MNPFNLLLIEPLRQIFLFWLGVANDAGLATILFSLSVRLPLIPIYWIIHKEEDRLKRIQARVKEATAVFGKSASNKKEKIDFIKQAEIVSRVYQEEKFNPLVNFLIQLSPLPILFALFGVFNQLRQSSEALRFLNLIDLKQPNMVLAAATLIFQLLSLQNQPKETRKIAFFSIGLIGVILFITPAIFTLYWIIILAWTLLEKKAFHWVELKRSSGTK